MTPRLLCAARPWRAPLLLVLATLSVACSDTSDTGLLDPANSQNRVLRTGALQLEIAGVPGSASVTISGSNYSTTVASSTTLNSLAVGTYTITSSAVDIAGTAYTPTPASQQVNVRRNATAYTSVTYTAGTTTPPTPTTGALAVSIVGLPSGTAGSVSVTSTNGYATTLSSSNTLSELQPGTYTLSASPIASGGTTYTPTPQTQSVSVTSNTTSGAGVSYSGSVYTPPSSSLNLRIDAAYITQATQRLDNRVPLVAGKNGVLRVFATANGSNAAQPIVRARFYRYGSLVSTLTANAPSGTVPTSVNEGSLSSSWNISVPGSLLQPGTSVVADVDAGNSVAESDESDNAWPSSGSPITLDVRVVPPFNLTFVPVLQSATGQQGNVSYSNTEQYLSLTRQMHPLSTINVTIRSPYTTSNTLQSNGTGWGEVLSELYALRAADASYNTYYGIAKVGYSSGVAGIGYIGAPAALSYDWSSIAADITAHELGHTWGRDHAPCGVSGDASYPYSGGTIGAYGFNVGNGQLIAPSTSDIMGYCSPQWISDYTYNGIMAYRGTSASMVAAASAQSVNATRSTFATAQAGTTMLVWGRITASGSLVIEPAVAVDAAPLLPARAGRYTVEGTDAQGATLFSISFDPVTVADGAAAGEQHFAFTVPVSASAQERLSALRLVGNGRLATVAVNGAAAEAALESASLSAVGSGRARLRWNSTNAPVVMVRDPDNGQVLAFARGGDVTITTAKTELQLLSAGSKLRATRRQVIR